MRIRTLMPALCALALLALLAAAPLARADDAATYDALMKAKAPTVVSVKFVLNVKVTQNGVAVMAPQEQSGSATGVIVDASGLIMIPGNAFGAGGIPRQIRRRFQISAVPSNIRVVFPGDTKEYQAVLGAKDSKLGLAFVLIRDLEGKTITAINTTTVVEPKVGQSLYGVSRLDQGFDHAPMVTRSKVAGTVSKPRDMWIIQGVGNGIGKPLYDAAGAMAGIVVTQEGVGEDSAMRPFLLPLAVATPTIKNGLAKSKAELERVLEEEEEAAAEAEEDGEAEDSEDEKKDGDAKKGDEKKDDGKKDDDK